MKGRKNIVWIASYPKSGSTWFRAFLGNIISTSDQKQNINQLDINNIASSRSLFDQFSGVHASDLSAREIEVYRPFVYRQLSNVSNETIYMKVHDGWTLNCDGKPLFPPEVTQSVIYIIRNPLDVAVSLSFHNCQGVNKTLQKLNEDSNGLCTLPEKLHNQLPQKLLSWSHHVESWMITSKLNVHIIRYEDLLENSQETFSRALRFLNIGFTDKKLKTAVNNSSFDVLKQQETEFGFREKPMRAQAFFRRGKKSDWVNYIDDETGQKFLSENSRIVNLFYNSNNDSK